MLPFKGHSATLFSATLLHWNGAPYGIRTRVTAVRGRCPRPLDEGDLNCLVPEVSS